MATSMGDYELDGRITCIIKKQVVRIGADGTSSIVSVSSSIGPLITADCALYVTQPSIQFSVNTVSIADAFIT
jgi:hypothetical protein